MSKGLTLNKNTFDLSLEDTDGKMLSELATSDYTVSVTAEAGRDTNFTVSLKKEYLQKADFYAADHVSVKILSLPLLERGKKTNGVYQENYKQKR